jgi:catechol 2,3-dioxygenase-like lactoylglutathione lyase family enzyme
MAVKRIVANIAADRIDAAKTFYGDALGLDIVRNHGWTITFAAESGMALQINVAVEGRAGTPIPNVSIEVDNLMEVYRIMQAAGFTIEYGPVTEPWGVVRFYVYDPFGRLVNVSEHPCR